jgi:hypothetical protein
VHLNDGPFASPPLPRLQNILLAVFVSSQLTKLRSWPWDSSARNGPRFLKALKNCIRNPYLAFSSFHIESSDPGEPRSRRCILAKQSFRFATGSKQLKQNLHSTWRTGWFRPVPLFFRNWCGPINLKSTTMIAFAICSLPSTMVKGYH